MQMRSGRLVAPPPPPPPRSLRGASRCQRCPEDRISALPDHVPSDRISALPDDVLLSVLVRLRCAREAVRTGVLSSRWRDLWTLLPELRFNDVHVDSVQAALARVIRPDLLVLDICLEDQHGLQSKQLTSLLWAAARLAPANLSIALSDRFYHRFDGEVLPCLHRTTSLQLTDLDLVTKPPLWGEFTVLERLTLHSCKVDLGTLIPKFPRLRVLNITDYTSALGEDLTVHSSSLEELSMEILHHNFYLEVIDIEAPVLKKVAVMHAKLGITKVSLSIPMVEEFWWCTDYDHECDIMYTAVGSEIWRLRSIGFGWGPPLRPGDETMTLNICNRDPNMCDLLPDAPSITQAIAQLPVPVTNLAVLVLHILAEGHVIGPLVLQLFQFLPSIQRFMMVLVSGESEEEDEASSCPCGEPESWKSDDVSLMGLEVVEIDGFDGKDHELDLLALIFRCAPKLETVSVTFSEDAPSEKMNDIYNISAAYPSVQCSVMSKSILPKMSGMQSTG